MTSSEVKSRRRAGAGAGVGVGVGAGYSGGSIQSISSSGTRSYRTSSSSKRDRHHHKNAGLGLVQSNTSATASTTQSRQPQGYRGHGRQRPSSGSDGSTIGTTGTTGGNTTLGGSTVSSAHTTNTRESRRERPSSSSSSTAAHAHAHPHNHNHNKPTNTIAVPRPRTSKHSSKSGGPNQQPRARTLSPRRPSQTPPTHPNPAQLLHNQGNARGEQQLPAQLTQQQRAERASVKRAIEDLNKAIGHERRIAAITNACEEFDHWDVKKHDLELGMGAANVLSLVLSMTDNDDEIRMICAALEMVYRGSHEFISRSFAEVGAAVVPLLLRLLERCESGNMRNADVSIMNITKVLLYFSRVQNLRLPLVRHQGLLAALVRVSTSILNADSRVVRMRVLANLANSEVNRVTMFEHAGLVDSVVKLASLDLSDSAREYAAAALMDLAGSPLNQVPMARNDKLLSTLVRLSVTDPKAETREYAVTAIQNLAFAKENRGRLARFCNGVVLEAMKKIVMSEDQNDKARRRAAGALTNLACDETAEMIGQHDGLLDVLAEVSTEDRSDDVQKRASLALTKIANSITSQMPCHATLLSSLVKASSSPNGFNVAAVLRAKARIVENRFSMARHPDLLDTLARIASSDQSSHKDKDDAMRAIMHLTNENANRKMMANKGILNALVKAALLDCENHAEEIIRDSAITAIERLATEVTNRKVMARHEGLLVAIAKATEREAKTEKLSPDASKVHLAKPLLMSLLVAM